MKAADEIIADGNRDLGVALESLKKTDRKSVKTAQTKTELGLGQKDSLMNVFRNWNPRRLKQAYIVSKWCLN